MPEALFGVMGALVGAAFVWLVARSRRGEVENAFKALASDALRANTDQLVKLSEQVLQGHLHKATGDLDARRKAVEDLVKPVQDVLKQYQEKSDLMERERQTAYGGLSKLLDTVRETQEKLKAETGNLVSALRQPNVRGRWGELTLRRVAELAGLSAHCDFSEQFTVETEEGALRPDLVVHLPNRREIVVDAKAVLSGYLEAMEATSDDLREAALKRHAGHLRDRMKLLSSKKYWGQFEQSAEFVVLFVPGEPFLSAAVQHDPNLIEEALANRVVVATPTTLVALLKAVAYGWRQEQMAQNAQEVAALGKKLLEAVAAWTGHVQKLRGAIFDTVESFNAAQASLERNVLPKARQMKELGVQGEKELPAIEPVDKVPKPVRE